MAPEILYLRGRSAPDAELLDAFEEHGLEVEIFERTKEIVTFCKKNPSRAIIVDASASDDELETRMTEVSAATELQEKIILFIGKNVSAQIGTRFDSFSSLIPVDHPFRLGSLLARFESSGEVAEDTPREEKSTKVTVAPTDVKDGFGGAVLFGARSIEDFDDSLLIPAGASEAVVAALDAITEADPILGAHVRRATFVSSTIANKLSCTAEQDDLIRQSNLLINWSSAGKEKLSLKVSPNIPLPGPAFDQMANSFRESAALVAEEVGNEEVVALIGVVADYLSGKVVMTDPEQQRAAQCVLASEIVGRACWNEGAWNEFGAYQALATLRTNTMFDDSQVVVSFGQVVGEALREGGQAVTRFIRQTPVEEMAERKVQAEAAIESAREKFKGSDTHSVKLHQLVPGMQLGEPLVSVDSVIVLEANTIIDNDLLMRVLQLAAVRPLRDPVVFNR